MINNLNKKLGDDILKDVFSRVSQLEVTVVGDICLDAYWEIDMMSKDSSLETGLLVNSIRRQRYNLAGAANVIRNLHALNVGKINAVGFVGRDIWGRELMSQLGKIANTEFVLRPRDFHTLVYCKPLRGNLESHRFDFGSHNVLGVKMVSDLVKAVRKAIVTSDVIIINQQIKLMGHPMLLGLLNELVNEFPEKIFIADSRHFPDNLSDCYMKLNRDEASQLVGQQDSISMAKALFQKLGHRVYLTCGADGIVVADENGEYQTTVITVEPPIDVVGAGDTVISTIATMLGLGCNPQDAAEMANLAGSIVVKKLFITGVATQSELLQNIRLLKNQ